jgi:hypothetical protein
MVYAVQAFAVFMCLFGLAALIKPGIVFDFVGKYADSKGLFLTAIGIRVVMGVLLLLLAAQSKHPGVMLVLGWIVLLAAVGIALTGQTTFKELLHWVQGFNRHWGRLSGLLAALFGYYLFYVFS